MVKPWFPGPGSCGDFESVFPRDDVGAAARAQTASICVHRRPRRYSSKAAPNGGYTRGLPEQTRCAAQRALEKYAAASAPRRLRPRH